MPSFELENLRISKNLKTNLYLERAADLFFGQNEILVVEGVQEQELVSFGATAEQSARENVASDARDLVGELETLHVVADAHYVRAIGHYQIQELRRIHSFIRDRNLSRNNLDTKLRMRMKKQCTQRTFMID